MRYAKAATAVEDQADQLISRGLIVDDRNKLIRYLFAVGYYRLSAYWLPFEEPPASGQTRSKRFKPSVSLETILSVYIFDRKLRLLLMEAIERIEIVVRSRWTNRLTLHAGPHAHLDCENFSDAFAHTERLRRINNNTKVSNEVFVEHYKRKYDVPHLPPLWAACELMTFGELSKFYASTRNNKIKADIARDLGLPRSDILESALHCLSYIRNICAHHGRIWNRRLVIKPKSIKKHKKSFQYDANGEITNQIYNVIVIILVLIQHQSPESTYRARLIRLLSELDPNLLTLAGFPANWKSLPIWV